MSIFTLRSSVPAGGEEEVQLILDDFEAGKRIMYPSGNDSDVYPSRYIWQVDVVSPAAATTSISTAEAHDGAQSLLINATAGDGTIQIRMNPSIESLAGWPNGKTFLKRLVNNPTMTYVAGDTPGDWPGLNTVNRLEFWMKLPAGYSYDERGVGNHQVEFGTFLHRVEDELNGSYVSDTLDHWYHFFAVETTGRWERCIVDMHPDHRRGETPNVFDQPDNPTAALALYNSAYNYFDLMTNFYVDFIYDSGNLGEHRLDGFRFYQETNTENTEQIRALHGVYVPADTSVEVGWSYSKSAGQSGETYRVRYAFSDIHVLGWANATDAPSGTIVASGDGGNMRYVNTTIDVGANTSIFIAIKTDSTAAIRQIEIPTT